MPASDLLDLSDLLGQVSSFSRRAHDEYLRAEGIRHRASAIVERYDPLCLVDLELAAGKAANPSQGLDGHSLGTVAHFSTKKG